jgi:transcriptional regulator with XRE-family HTH domain
MEVTKLATGEKIKLLREKMRLTQSQIAEFLEIDQTTFSKCENGERRFTVDALERLCSLFGCTLSDLKKSDAVPVGLEYSFRAKMIQPEDLRAIAHVNRIALYLEWMEESLGEE